MEVYLYWLLWIFGRSTSCLVQQDICHVEVIHQYSHNETLYDEFFIDFSKAFDSIKSGILIQVLKKYSIHPKIIDIIAHIYEKDKTQVYFNNTHQADIDVTSGIRQGCNGSSNLFLLVTYLIIEKMYDCLNGVNTNI